MFPVFSNFSEIPCVKIGLNVNDFLCMMNESRFPECGRFHFLLSSWTSTCGDSLFVIQKAKLLHMNTVVNIAPRELYFHSKGMLVVFLRYKILILVFLGSSGKFCAEMKFWYFWVCSFSISSKNEKFPKSFQ